MNNNLKDILSNLNKDTKQNKLLEYLNEQLSPEEQHAVEANLNDDEFMSDAIDGLKDIEDKKQVEAMVAQLNAGLKKQLDKRKRQKDKRKLPTQPWVYYTIILLLTLIVVAYLIIKKLHS